MNGKGNSIQLRVAESSRVDVGRGIARVGSLTRERLNINPGDTIEIKGKKSAVAIIWPLHSPEEDGIIKIDGYVRRNVGVSLGDPVIIRPIKIGAATKVILAPSQALQFGNDFNNYAKHQILGRPLGRGDLVSIPVLGDALPMVVMNVSPAPYAIVDKRTDLQVRAKPPKENELGIPKISYEDIGGLQKEIQRVRELIELPLKHPELFIHLGIEPPNGVLLMGSPGTGKTLLAKAVANESGAHFIAINGPEIMSKWYGESEKRLRDLFQEAKQRSPSIVFFDEIDAIAPKREEVTGEVEKRVVAQLLSLMDGLGDKGNIIVIGATNRPDALDPALRRPGRFDREITIGIPDKNGRKEVLTIHTRNMPIHDDVNLDHLAKVSHGYVGADLAALAKEAAMSSLRRFLPEIDLDQPTIPTEILQKMKVKKIDFDEAQKDVHPSTLREVYLELPDVNWNDVKKQLNEAIEWPLLYPQLFERLGVRPAKGILLFGPPGTGKTMLAKAAASQSESNFIAIRGPEILSKWVGDSQKAVRKTFKKARESAPCIVFFDELDAIAPRRGIETAGVSDKIVNQLLSEMDGIDTLKNVVVIGATNRPDMLDPALLRPGRFDKIIYVGPPSLEVREEIIKIHTKKMPLANDISIKQLADMTEGYTGADIEAFCLESVMSAARQDINVQKIEMKHFEDAIQIIPPSLNPSELREYEMLAEKISRKVKDNSTQVSHLA